MTVKYLISQIAMLLFLLIVLASLGFYIRIVNTLVGWLKNQWNPEFIGGIISFIGLIMILSIFLPIAAHVKLILFANSMIMIIANYQDEKVTAA